MEYIDEKLVVDELIIDPGLPNHVVVRIEGSFYMIRNTVTKVEEKDLSPYKKHPYKSWYRPTSALDYWMRGLIPRAGYRIEIGRPATEKEFSAIVENHGLSEDDISDEFTDSVGEIYGQKYRLTFLARQIRIEPAGKALAIVQALQAKGIQASNGSPGRINIRVEQSGKQ
ncbi:hypothetical protein A8L34_28050 [Bacillus sp. FJAT-27264]|uniref:hypothetical protein n=1 Tax=Paenibacillus sp. (strain DSM 101736 / FJAT-27264) TaxID=1850362 RepID=UPI000807B176|nr:hypothetical protein [Bacillus sp. FJAT-27264]OBZ15902.1 hypothetical protein A8L34_28050 [Bacillus sp. FJAT-27264]